MKNNRYYELLITLKKNDDISKIVEEFGENESLYEGLLNHHSGKSVFSIDEIINFVKTSPDEEVEILYKELLISKYYMGLKEKYPKLLTTIKLRNNHYRQEIINQIINDEIYLNLIDLSSNLNLPDFRPFYANLLLSILYDHINMTDKAVKILSDLRIWYSESEILIKQIENTILNFYLWGKNKRNFTDQIEKTGDKRFALIYKMAYFIWNHSYLLTWIYIAINLVLYILIKSWIILILSIYIALNIIGLVDAIKKPNRTITVSYVQNLYIFFVSIIMSAFLYFIGSTL